MLVGAGPGDPGLLTVRAVEALKSADVIVHDGLIDPRVLDLAPDYLAPPMRTIRALGREALGNLKYALFAFQEGGQASAHDVYIGNQVAYVLSGGDGPPASHHCGPVRWVCCVAAAGRFCLEPMAGGKDSRTTRQFVCCYRTNQL